MVRIDGAFLRSKVGRRIFFLFLLASIVPVALMATLTYRGVSKLLAAHESAELAAYSKNYGMAFFSRLTAAQRALQAVRPDHPEDATRLLVSQGQEPALFRAIALIRQDQSVQYLGADPNLHKTVLAAVHESQRPSTAPKQGSTLALLPAVAPGASAVALTQSASARGYVDARLTAVLEPSYLFGDRELLPKLTELCVIRASDGAPLYCSQADMVARAQRALEQAAGPQSDAGIWTLYATGDVAFSPLALVSMRQPVAGGGDDHEIGRNYVEVALVAAVLVALLSLTQIRRILVPLGDLIDATHRVAAGNFTQLLKIDRTDEFGRLAHSFNDMTLQIDGQIHALKTLSAIDHEILSGLDVDRVVERVMQRIEELAPACNFAIARLSRGFATHCVAPTWRINRNGVEKFAVAIDEKDWLRMTQCEGAQHPLGPGVEDLRLAEALLGICTPQHLLLPVASHDRRCTLIVLGVTSGPVPGRAQLHQIRELGNRLGVAFDAAERNKVLIDEARSDSLTGLPNRLKLHELIEKRTAADDGEKAPFALLFIDLDRFKGINDALGHNAGDALLRESALRIQGCLHAKDMVARLGGDEFVVLAEASLSGIDGYGLPQTIIAALSAPFQIGPAEVNVGASIGIAFFPQDGTSREALIRNADTAMYQAKGQGRGRFVHFQEDMSRSVIELLTLETDLRAALERDDIQAYFQPRVRLDDGRTTGVEALARWLHSTHGYVSPERFIALAEEIGVIEDIGERMLVQSALCLANWRRRGLAVEHVSVNVSTRQLRDSSIATQFSRIIKAAGLSPADIELEITESAMVHDIAQTRKTLEQLRRVGFRIALDDFGTGYSSMSYLQNFPIDVIKIDRSFVKDIVSSKGARAIAVAIVSLAKALGLRIVAEGVETREQEEMLRGWGCQEAQGFLYAKALTAAAFEEFLGNQAAHLTDRGHTVAASSAA